MLLKQNLNDTMCQTHSTLCTQWQFMNSYAVVAHIWNELMNLQFDSIKSEQRWAYGFVS